MPAMGYGCKSYNRCDTMFSAIDGYHRECLTDGEHVALKSITARDIKRVSAISQRLEGGEGVMFILHASPKITLKWLPSKFQYQTTSELVARSGRSPKSVSACQRSMINKAQ